MRSKFSSISDPNSFVSDAGDRYHIVYGSTILPDGTISLREKDRIDIREEINSHRDETDMAFILNRLRIGDTSVISRNTPAYGDFTKLPRSLAEFEQLRIDAERTFYELPLSVRQQFGNSFVNWMSEIGSPEWMSIMCPVDSSVEPAVEPAVESFKEVKSDEP